MDSDFFRIFKYDPNLEDIHTRNYMHTTFLGQELSNTDLSATGHTRVQGWALRSFKERNILLCSFFEFLAIYESQKNNVFFFAFFS